jgi:hypothetical protein
MISTQNLSELPSPEALKKLTKALAMLDAVIERDWEYRYYSFNSKWSASEEMASMRNGEGDGWSCVFGPAGVFLKGFDHESLMSPWSREGSTVWPGVINSVPAAFQSCVKEPAFSMADTTFCIWRAVEGKTWETGEIAFPDGDDPDGSGELLSVLEGDPQTYKRWAEEYFGRSLSSDAIHRIYRGEALTPDLVRQLNPEIEFATILADAAEINYPIAE